MKNIKSHFVFNTGQRFGILTLLVLIIAALSFYFYYPNSSTNILDIDSPKVAVVQKKIDSLRLLALEKRKPKIYPFNPNFITDYKAYTLGMSTKEFDRLRDFRNQDKWINSVADFKTVTKVSDSLLETISPFFKFPDWVTNPKPKFQKNSFDDFSKDLSFSDKTDLNSATQEELEKISGIGPALSARIIKYRASLGGFSQDDQLYEVYGLKPEVIAKALKRFTVKTPKVIDKMNINVASASDIATLPGISFDLAKEIWEFRVLREKIENLEELLKIEGMSGTKLRTIRLYLSTE